MTRETPGPVHLVRTISVTQATLYGLGVTIGAGIYVMIGAAAGRAGMQAPLAFLLAAALMALSAASFAELAGRLPVAAGEAAYVRAAFGSDRLATGIGLLVVAIALVSSAAISGGAAGYLGVFLPLPHALLIALVVVGMGAVACGRVGEAVSFAGLMTAIEIGGLLVVIAAGALWGAGGDLVVRLPEVVPRSGASLLGVLAATPIAVFAFIGFESLANIAEEVREPRRSLPRAMLLTLVLSTVLYLGVLWIALTTIGPEELAASRAPLALLFERLTGASPRVMSAIAVIATLNGIIVQILMASRVIYGLAGQGNLPAALGSVNPRTRTPLVATGLVTAIVLALALGLPLHRLAELTSHLTLLVFAAVNLALVRLKARDGHAPADRFSVPAWVPWAGFVACLAVAAADLVRMGAG